MIYVLDDDYSFGNTENLDGVKMTSVRLSIVRKRKRKFLSGKFVVHIVDGYDGFLRPRPYLYLLPKHRRFSPHQPKQRCLHD